jgi:hypothetical protein
LGDPDTLFRINNHLFEFSLVEGDTILRGTLVAWDSTAVPTPSTLWLMSFAVIGLAGFGRNRESS